MFITPRENDAATRATFLARVRHAQAHRHGPELLCCRDRRVRLDYELGPLCVPSRLSYPSAARRNDGHRFDLVSLAVPTPQRYPEQMPARWGLQPFKFTGEVLDGQDRSLVPLLVSSSQIVKPQRQDRDQQSRKRNPVSGLKRHSESLVLRTLAGFQPACAESRAA